MNHFLYYNAVTYFPMHPYSKQAECDDKNALCNKQKKSGKVH